MMIKRLWLLLAAMFVVSMMFVAPVFASGNGDWNNGDDNDRCWVHDNNNNHDDDDFDNDGKANDHDNDDDNDGNNDHADNDDDWNA